MKNGQSHPDNTDNQSLPEHLRGTRQGLFYLLNINNKSAPPVAPNEGRKPAAGASPKTDTPAKEPGEWQGMLNTDNFIFFD